jgi:hypothetical protein
MQTCVAGDQLSCGGPDMLWTGDLCCTMGTVCAAGTALECDSAEGMLWTGDQCCVVGAATCSTDSDSVACGVAGGLWTGSACCQ